MIELSLKRVILLWKLQLHENMRRYLIGAFSVFLLLLVGLYKNKSGDGLMLYYNPDSYWLLIYAVMAGLFAVSLVKPLKRGSARIMGLNLPVSAADRVLLILINTYVLYPVAFFIVAGAAIYLSGLLSGEQQLSIIGQFYNMYGGATMYGFIIAIVTLCAACFKRFIEFKAILAVFIILLLNSQSFIFLSDLLIDVPDGKNIHNTADIMDNQEKWGPEQYRLLRVEETVHLNKKTFKKIVHYTRVAGRMPMGMLVLRGYIRTAPLDEDQLPFGVRPGANVSLVRGKMFGDCYNLYLVLLIFGFWVTIWLKIKEIEL